MPFSPGPMPYRPPHPQQPHGMMNPNAGTAHPNMMFSAPMMPHQPHQAMRPMPNTQFINAFPRPNNGFPMPQHQAAMAMNPYQARGPPFQQHRQFIQAQPSPQQPPVQAAPPPRPKRPTRNAKKRVTYDESSDEDDDDLVSWGIFLILSGFSNDSYWFLRVSCRRNRNKRRANLKIAMVATNQRRTKSLSRREVPSNRTNQSSSQLERR